MTIRGVIPFLLLLLTASAIAQSAPSATLTWTAPTTEYRRHADHLGVDLQRLPGLDWR